MRPYGDVQKPLVQHFSRRLDRTGGTIRGILKESKGKQLDLGGALSNIPRQPMFACHHIVFAEVLEHPCSSPATPRGLEYGIFSTPRGRCSLGLSGIPSSPKWKLNERVEQSRPKAL